MRCPKCGSENISSIIDTKTHTKGFDGGDACCRILTFWMARDTLWFM